MDWPCKICKFATSTKEELMKHYRLRHIPSVQPLPCPYLDCFCSFKSWGSLKSHISRKHSTHSTVRTSEILSFCCQFCNVGTFSTEKEYFEHLRQHLKKQETVSCVFKNCSFKTNIYGTFASHKHRKHTPHSLDEFKEDVLKRFEKPLQTDQCSDVVNQEGEQSDIEEFRDDDVNVLPKLIERSLAHLMLKLESSFHVPNQCIDELVESLHFICHSASAPIMKDILQSCLKRHNCEVDEAIVSEMVNNICVANPVSAALCDGGPLSSAFKRRKYFNEHFSVVEPIEYILTGESSFQYVPILKSLLQVLSRKDILDLILSEAEAQRTVYNSFHDGTFYKTNELFSKNDLTIALNLYVDDFEICNPLGTSRKKHKITSVYWVLADVPSLLRSELNSIFLAILCKAEDVKRFGYSAVLEPLLKDLVVLEEEGLYVPSLGRRVKGTVFSVIADNLGAHSMGGFVESFSSSYVCRFCLGEKSQFQDGEVRNKAFPPRTAEQHTLHVQALQENNSLMHVYGVKRQCALTAKLKYFHVLSGYPPDVLHDLFEGVVPLEIALCLRLFIHNKYFTLEELNKCIKEFPYKWSDKTNAPQLVPVNFAQRKSVGGNAHENWALLRLLPLMVGSKIPEADPAWELLLVLRDIVELVVNQVHTEETICFLDSKISEHKHRFLMVFPEQRLIPKHHFLEHYPELIRAYGPLVSLWTMRFEAKHSFFKRVVRHTRSFRNILLSLAMKHQLLLAYNQHDSRAVRPLLQATTLSTMDVSVLREDIQEALQAKFPGETCVQIAKSVCYRGTKYTSGMILAYGSTGGLPDFGELIQIVVLKGNVGFIVKGVTAWSIEHLRSYVLEKTGTVKVIEAAELSDMVPLISYICGGTTIMTLKCSIYVP